MHVLFSCNLLYIPVRDDMFIDLCDLGLCVISFQDIFALREKNQSHLGGQYYRGDSRVTALEVLSTQ